MTRLFTLFAVLGKSSIKADFVFGPSVYVSCTVTDSVRVAVGHQDKSTL